MSFYIFKSPVVVSIAGKHAARYLHNRLSNDITSLAIGAHCQAGALSPQGKVEALGICLRRAESDYVFYTLGGSSDEIAAALSRYRVAESVTFKIENNLVVVHCYSELKAHSIEAPIEIEERRVQKFGRDMLISPDQLSQARDKLLALGHNEASDDEFYLVRFNSNTPIFPNEISQELLLAEAGLTNAVSFTKGCYVGQEVIAKIDAIGKAPRQIVRVQGYGELHSGDKLMNSEGAAIGTILSVGHSGAQELKHAFAIVRSSFTNSTCKVGTQEFRIL